jgi:hypothetical protein
MLNDRFAMERFSWDSHKKYMTQLEIITPQVIYINIFSPYFRISFFSSYLIKASIVDIITEKMTIDMK